jgi:epoxyqueuosine reductase
MSLEQLREWARELDVDAIGAAPFAGNAGEGRHQQLPGLRSVIIMAAAYLDERPSDLSEIGDPHGIVAFSEWKDHYPILRGKAERLASSLQEQGVRAVLADGLPMRELAVAAGIGTLGKNSLLQSYDHGSWVLLVGVLTDLEFTAQEAEGCRCGSCQACLRLCPTHAIREPFKVYRERCLSHLLSREDTVPMELRDAIGRRVVSCDVCLEVCPRNRFVSIAPIRSDDRFGEWTRSASLRSLANINVDDYRLNFSSLGWGEAGRFLLRRNAIIALGNSADISVQDCLIEELSDPDPRLRGYAAWALVQLGSSLANEAVCRALLTEKDEFASGEMRSALARLSEK